MATISASVGQGGRNLPNDVRTVQELLNTVREGAGGPSSLLTVNGICEPSTIVAIKKFQWRQTLPVTGPRSRADGRVDPHGGALRKLNEFASGGGPAYSPPAGTRGVDLPLLFTTMWDLIQRKHTRETATFPAELLIGMFWEETNFINRAGIRNRNVLGFGQVNRDNISDLSTQFGISLSAERILGSDYFEESVEVASVALANALLRVRNAHRESMENALHYYATGNQHDRNPQVSRWVHCMNRLLELRLPASTLIPFSDEVGVKIREILWSDQHVVFNPDVAFA
jgi:hypothetical protein